jgi:DNA-binding XRE family transcriptional regulator
VAYNTDGHDSEPFQSLLLRYRGRTGLTQRELAARAGVHVRSVQDWESGTNYPGSPRLQALIGVLFGGGRIHCWARGGRSASVVGSCITRVATVACAF